MNTLYLCFGDQKHKKKEGLIDNEKHLILKTSHPSPLSSYRGFLDVNIFQKQMHI